MHPPGLLSRRLGIIQPHPFHITRRLTSLSILTDHIHDYHRKAESDFSASYLEHTYVCETAVDREIIDRRLNASHRVLDIARNRLTRGKELLKAMRTALLQHQQSLQGGVMIDWARKLQKVLRRCKEQLNAMNKCMRQPTLTSSYGTLIGERVLTCIGEISNGLVSRRLCARLNRMQDMLELKRRLFEEQKREREEKWAQKGRTDRFIDTHA